MEKPINEVTTTKKKKERRNKQPINKLHKLKVFPEAKLPPIQGESPHQLALRRLKSRLLPLERHPVYGQYFKNDGVDLSKWLKVSQGNIFMAEAKIRNCLKFRHKMSLDTLLDTYVPPDVLLTHYPGGLCGEDRDGSPVSYEFLGLLDLGSMMKAVNREDLKTFRLYQYEKISQYLKKLSIDRGRKIDSILVVVDMNGTSVDKLWSPSFLVWKEAFELLQTYYPGLVKEILIIRPTSVLSELYLSLRPYISKSLDLFTIEGHAFFKALHKRIKAHQIPAYLGGYKCDFDNNPLCTSWLTWPYKIPEWQFYTDDRMCADVTKMSVPGGGTKIEEVHIAQARTNLIWEIHDMSNPFVFAVYQANFKDDKKVIVPRITMTKDSKYRTGSFPCRSPGRYFVIFDNWKTLGRPLRLVYRIDTRLPLTFKSKLQEQIPLGDMIDPRQPINEREQAIRNTFLHQNTRFGTALYASIVGSGMDKLKDRKAIGGSDDVARLFVASELEERA